MELAPPEEWANLKVGGIAKSLFMKQFKKENATFLENGGFENLALLMRSETSMTALKNFGKRRVTQCRRYLMRRELDGGYSGGVHSVSSSITPSGDALGSWNLASLDDEPDVTISESAVESSKRKRKYPVEDTQLVQTGSRWIPEPKHSHQIMDIFSSPDAQEAIYLAYATINNFRSDLKLPFLPLRTLQEALASDVIHPVLREVHCVLLSAVLDELLSQQIQQRPDSSSEGFFSSLAETLWWFKYSQDISLDQEEASAYLPYHRLLLPPASSSSSSLSPFAPDPSDSISTGSPVIAKDRCERMSERLRVGDGWLEVLRLLACHRFQLPVGEYLDALTECQRIAEALAALPEAAPFSRPVDKESLPGYDQAVDTPMDLGTVLNRLDNGWLCIFSL